MESEAASELLYSDFKKEIMEYLVVVATALMVTVYVVILARCLRDS